MKQGLEKIALFRFFFRKTKEGYSDCLLLDRCCWTATYIVNAFKPHRLLSVAAPAPQILSRLPSTELRKIQKSRHVHCIFNNFGWMLRTFSAKKETIFLTKKIRSKWNQVLCLSALWCAGGQNTQLGLSRHSRESSEPAALGEDCTLYN